MFIDDDALAVLSRLLILVIGIAATTGYLNGPAYAALLFSGCLQTLSEKRGTGGKA
jgi:hypothetical protein